MLADDLSAAEEPLFPSRLSFIVQFAREGEESAEPNRGYIEHVTTGRSARFGSTEELLSFIQSTLAAKA
ncbi:MAG TPA: hypothetical protein VEB21_10210 [Terriglobales bacterium]|nr:hypothetical protein [Terriglobales bacterium]